ncbi:MAG: DNA-binding protein [Casimicrobium sp.]
MLPEDATDTPLTPAQIKQRLWFRGDTLKSWAQANGYSYGTVSAVMTGRLKVTRNYGVGYDIARKLGLVIETASGRIVHGQRQDNP